MGERFTRWGKRPEEPKARALVARATFEGPILASEVPALPFAQTRTFNRGASVEKRAAGVAARLIQGKIPYNEVIQTADGFGELFAPGCFSANIAAEDPRVLANFNPEHVLGRKSSGTCQFWEQSDGLYFEAAAPETSWGTDLLTSMRRGDVDQAALVFYVMAYSWIDERDGLRVRAITRGILVAASICSFSSMGTAQAETAQAITAARAEGYQAGRASAASKPQALVSATAQAQLSAPISARTMSTRKMRAQIERMNHV
jgi:HK97 family phage prohead protease